MLGLSTSQEINTYDTKNAKSIQMPNNKTAIIEKKIVVLDAIKSSILTNFIKFKDDFLPFN